MIDASTISPDAMTMTTRLICQEAAKRGWKAGLYYVGDGRVRLQRPDGKILEVAGSASPDMPYYASRDADNKFITHIRLQEAGLPVAKTEKFTATEAQQGVTQFLTHTQHIVIKPLDAAHGNGVTVGVSTPAQADQAVKRALLFSQTVIVQEFIPQAIDLRLCCIDGKLVGALQRLPARVKGDGQHTIEQLIDLENASDRRGENYRKVLNYIPKETARQFLGDLLMQAPAKDEWVQVIGTANVGMGGETVDITNDVPDWLKTMAEKAANTMHLPVCGVDFLVQQMPTPTASLQALGPIIIEINKSPSLFIHEQPIHGAPRPVVAALLDHLAIL
jgi:cyanophycin synthetase